MARRFGLNLNDELYEQFFRLFPDFGKRTSVVRRCIMRIVKLGNPDMTEADINNLTDGVYDYEKEE